MAPNVAERERVFSNNAFMGTRRPPLNINRTAKVVHTINPMAHGRALPMAFRASALRAARPVTRVGAGEGTARTAETRALPALE